MKRNPHAEITHMHHVARWFPGPERWVITNLKEKEPVAMVVTSTTRHEDPRSHRRWYTMTRLDITLILGVHRMSLDSFVRPDSVRTALRWAMAQFNNGSLWLGARLHLGRRARSLGYDESKILVCGHAYDYQYCLRLLASLPGLLES